MAHIHFPYQGYLKYLNVYFLYKLINSLMYIIYIHNQTENKSTVNGQNLGISFPTLLKQKNHTLSQINNYYTIMITI